MEKIKLIVSARLAEILNQMSDSIYAQYILNGVEADHLIVDHANYLDFAHDDGSKISYLNESRLAKATESGADVWTSYNLRYKAKPGSFLTKLFNPAILNSRIVEEFTNTFRSLVLRSRFQLEIVSGEVIRHWYYGSNYVSSNGSLGNSCMKYENCQNFFSLYIENNIQMAILLEDGRLLGRAILWEAKDSLTGELVPIMDRIYTADDDLLAQIFKDWAKANGRLYRHQQNWAHSLQWVQGDEIVEKRLEVKLPKSNFDRYPYMDSFKFLSPDGTLRNWMAPDFVQVDSSNQYRTLISPEGGYRESNVFVLDDLGRYYIHRSDAVHLPLEDIYTSPENVYHSNILNCVMLRTDGKYVNELGDYVYATLERNPLDIQEKLLALAAQEVVQKSFESLSDVLKYAEDTLSEVPMSARYRTYVRENVQRVERVERYEEQPISRARFNMNDIMDDNNYWGIDVGLAPSESPE